MLENKDNNTIEFYDDEKEYVICDMCGEYVHETTIKQGMCSYCFSMNAGDDC